MTTQNLALLLITISLLNSCSLFKQSYSTADIAKESKRLNEFFENSFEAKVARWPTWQTYLGRKTDYDKLDNHTEAYTVKEHQLNKSRLEKLYTFDFDALNKQSKLSYRIFEIRTKQSIEEFKWRHHSFPLNQMFGYQAETPSFLINMHQIDNAQDAADYISRLIEIRRLFKENLAALKIQEEKKIFPPKFVFSKVLDDAKNVITGFPFDNSPEDSPLMNDFNQKISKLKISNREKATLRKSAAQALKDYVRPAYTELIIYAKKLDDLVTENRGVWNLPEGEDYYNFRLRKITTTELTAPQIHALGLSEVKRIHQEMKTIAKKVSFKGELTDFFKFMGENKKFIYPNNPTGRAAYLSKAKKIIEKIKVALPEMFSTFPKAKLKVKAVERYREKSAGIAFYSQPAMEGNRPGIYYVNLYKMEDNPKYKMEALAYHEALPGHHMQISIATELKELPKFRRTEFFTAYSEGWGLYSEKLPKEYGFYTDPYSDFGRLAMELWRACRLVVDTGIHYKKWNREKAIGYLKQNTPNSDLEIEKGIERYFIMPGQATAYKIGMMKILELRKIARQKLGAKFDIRKFHDIVLRSGSIPLNILTEQVKTWISSSNTTL